MTASDRSKMKTRICPSPSLQGLLEGSVASSPLSPSSPPRRGPFHIRGWSDSFHGPPLRKREVLKGRAPRPHCQPKEGRKERWPSEPASGRAPSPTAGRNRKQQRTLGHCLPTRRKQVPWDSFLSPLQLQKAQGFLGQPAGPLGPPLSEDTQGFSAGHFAIC